MKGEISPEKLFLKEFLRKQYCKKIKKN